MSGSGRLIVLDATSPVLRLLPLVLIVSVGFLTVAAPLPIIPLFVHDHISRSHVFIGLLIGLQSITTVITRRHAGSVADTKGPKHAVVVGLFACIVAALSYVVAALGVVGDYASIGLLGCGRVILGFGESLLLTGAITWGIERVGTENAGKVMSWNGIAMYAALAGGAPLGVFLYTAGGADRHGFLVLGIAAALVPMLALAVAAMVPGVTPLPPRPMPIASVFKIIWPWGTVLTMQMVGFGTISSFLSLTFSSRGWAGAGVGFAGFGVAVIGARLMFGGMPDRLGGLKVAVVCLVTEGVGQVLLAGAWTPFVAILGCVITGLGCALAFPALGVEAMRAVPAENRGLVVGLFSAFQDIAFGVTGPVAGVVSGLSGYSGIFSMGAAASAVGLAILYRLSRRISHGTADWNYRFRPDGQAVVGHVSEKRF